jgi:hypothetical protein
MQGSEVRFPIDSPLPKPANPLRLFFPAGPPRLARLTRFVSSLLPLPTSSARANFSPIFLSFLCGGLDSRGIEIPGKQGLVGASLNRTFVGRVEGEFESGIRSSGHRILPDEVDAHKNVTVTTIT